MATDAKRAAALAEVISALDTLGGRAPGATLRAEDWNGLVDTVRRVARLGPDEAGAGGDEEPLADATVRFEHLSVDLQKLLRSGPFADPRERTERNELQRRLRAIEDQLGALGLRADGLLAAVNQSETQVSRGRNDLRNLTHQVQGVTGLQREVGDLRVLLGSVRSDIGSVLELREDLADVELRALAETVGSLEEFRDRWRGENGEPLGFEGFASRLAEVQATAITDDELQEVLDNRINDVVVDPDVLRAAVLADLRQELDAGQERLRADMAGRITEAGAELRASLGAEVERAVGARLGELDPRVRELAAAAATQAVAEGLDARDRLLRETVLEAMDARLRESGTVLLSRVDELAQQLEGRVSSLAQRMITRDLLESSLATVETRLAGSIAELDSRIRDESRVRADAMAGLRRERATALAETTQRLELLIGERIRNEAVARTDAITAAVGAAAEGRRTELDELRRSVAGQFQSQIGEAVSAQVGAARADLERRMRVVVADTTAALEADITDLRRRIR